MPYEFAGLKYELVIMRFFHIFFVDQINVIQKATKKEVKNEQRSKAFSWRALDYIVPYCLLHSTQTEVKMHQVITCSSKLDKFMEKNESVLEVQYFLHCAIPRTILENIGKI